MPRSTRTLPPDSFAIPDSLRGAFLRTASRPMHDIRLDSARVTPGRFVSMYGFGYPGGAVKIGRQWFMLEAGQHALNFERALEWMKHNVDGSVSGAFIGLARQGNGGVTRLAKDRLPMYVGAGGEPFVRAMLRNHGVGAATVHVVDSGRWLEVDGDSVRLETIDLPDIAGSLLVYVPSLHWVYVCNAVTPLDVDLVMARVRDRGWNADRIGSIRGLFAPFPGQPPAR
jgi:hypothetical protein